MALRGQSVLVIDIDPQGNATTGLGLSNNLENSNETIYAVLNGTLKISEVIGQAFEVHYSGIKSHLPSFV